MPKLKTCQLSPKPRQKRAEALQYLKDLFRLSFRVEASYNEIYAHLPAEDDEPFYDFQVDHMPGESAGFSSDEGMEDFRSDFRQLKAEKEFLICCVDYYQEVLTALQAKWAVLNETLQDLHAHNQTADHALLDKMIDNEWQQKAAQAKLQQYQQELEKFTRGKKAAATPTKEL